MKMAYLIDLHNTSKQTVSSVKLRHNRKKFERRELATPFFSKEWSKAGLMLHFGKFLTTGSAYLVSPMSSSLLRTSRVSRVSIL